MALYAALGYLVIPHWVEKRVPPLLKERYGIELSVGTLRFDPFAFTLDLRNFRLDAPGGKPLFRLRRMVVDPDLIGSLVSRSVRFDAIRFVEPELWVEVNEKGEPNFAHLLSGDTGAFEESPEGKKREEGSPALPPIRVGHFQIRDFRFHYEDRSFDHPVAFDSTPYTFTLENFSTEAEATSLLDFTVGDEKSGRTRIAARFSLEPLEVEGEATVEGFELKRFAPLLANVTPLRVEGGRTDFRIRYDLKREKSGFRLRLEEGRFNLQNVRLADGKETPLRLGDFRIEGMSARWPERRVKIGRIALADARIDVRREATGGFSFQRWVRLQSASKPKTQKSEKSETPASAPSRPSWHIEVDDVAMERTTTRFRGLVYDFDASYEARLKAITFDTTGRLNLQIPLLETGKIALKDHRGGSTPFSMKRVALEEGRVDNRTHRIRFRRAVVRDPKFAWTLYRQGGSNLDPILRLLAAETTPEPPETAERAAKSAPRPSPWLIRLERFDFEGGSLAFEDRRLEPPVQLAGTDIALKLRDFRIPMEKAVPYDFSMRLPGKGSLSARGNLAVAPLRLQSEIRARNLRIAPYMPIVGRYLNLEIPKGRFDADATLAYDETASPRGVLRFGMKLSDLSILHGSTKEKIFGLRRAEVEGGRLELGPDALAVRRFVVEAPTFDIHIRKDRTSNLDHILKTPLQSVAAGESNETASSPSTTPSLPFAVAHIMIRHGRGSFADDSLAIPFATSIHEMGGDLIGLNDIDGSVAAARFYGQIEKYGMMKAKSLFVSADPRLDTSLSVAFRNLDVTRASPYVSPYLGYEIADGRLWVNVDYTIREGTLHNRNKIVFRRLKLGKKIDDNRSVGASVKFALALMTDNKGNIDLDIPIEGNATGVKVDMSGIIFKALKHVVVKVVTLPFKILGEAIGVSGAALQYLQFDPGSAQIEPPQRETLDTLAAALPKEPTMRLVVPAVYLTEADTDALKRRKLNALLLEELKKESDRPVRSMLSSSALLESLYRRRAGEEALQAFEKEAKGTARTPKAYLEALYDKLLETFEVKESELVALAKERAEEAVRYLRKAGVPNAQLLAGEVKKAERLDDTGMVPVQLQMETEEK